MKLKSFLLSVICLGFAVRGFADGILISSAPLDEVTEERFEGSKTRSVEEILKLNVSLKSWPEAYEVLVGASVHQEDPEMFQGLVKQLSDPAVTKLTQTTRLILWPRIRSGEIFFEGKGTQVDDDLFSVAGRANWILRTLTKKNFGFVSKDPTKEQLANIQQSWTRFFNSEEVEEAPELFPSVADKGLSEIRSLDALDALIVSLKPSEQKSAYTKRLLKKLYDLDELPDDPMSPAQLCNPDTYTQMYLQVLTGVGEIHSHEWWADWWKENNQKLEWDPEVARFTIDPAPETPIRADEPNSDGTARTDE